VLGGELVDDAKGNWLMARTLQSEIGSGRLTWERVTGIEPALSAWEADVLPLNYTRGRCTG
jgi:hypothetical protein